MISWYLSFFLWDICFSLSLRSPYLFISVTPFLIFLYSLSLLISSFFTSEADRMAKRRILSLSFSLTHRSYFLLFLNHYSLLSVPSNELPWAISRFLLLVIPFFDVRGIACQGKEEWNDRYQIKSIFNALYRDLSKAF